MEFELKEAAVYTDQELEMTRIAPEIRAFVEESGIENRLAYAITEHTTTSITVNESLDCVEKDIMECSSRIVPEDYPHYHSHYLPTYGTIGENTSGYPKFLLIGNHCVSPIIRGRLKLGHIADIYFCEHDGIKMRYYMIYIVGERKEQGMKRAIAMTDNCTDVYYKLDRYYLTGGSIDFAFNYRDLDDDVTEMTILGNDVSAMALEECLKERGIAPHVLKCVDRPTGMATVDIVDEDKKHLHFEGNAMKEIELSGEGLEFVKSFDVVYAGRWSKIDRYIKELKRPGQTWVYDFSKRLGQEGNDLILPHLDYVFFSYDRDDGYIEDFMIKVRKRGTDTVITMLGGHGSLTYDGDRLYEKEAERVPVANTMGAGSSYITAFTYGVGLGESISQCIDRGKKRTTEIIRQSNPCK